MTATATDIIASGLRCGNCAEPGMTIAIARHDADDIPDDIPEGDRGELLSGAEAGDAFTRAWAACYARRTGSSREAAADAFCSFETEEAVHGMSLPAGVIRTAAAAVADRDASRARALARYVAAYDAAEGTHDERMAAADRATR